jgi:hypothetical protein
MNDAENESPTSYYGPRQVHCPRRELIATFNGVSGAGGAVTFRVNTPDARLRGKFALICVPNTGTTAPPATCFNGRGVTVWPYAVEDDQVNGQRGTPVADMIPGVTFAAPLAIPVHARLGGWAREFVTSADGYEVLVTIPAQLGGVPCALYAQARYQPVSSAGFIPWQQWQEIRSELDIRLLGEVVRT